MSCPACTGPRKPTTTYCGECGTRIGRASSSDALLCTVLDDRYFIDQKIAAGGFGTIYRARSLETDTDVAIKILHAQHNADPAVSARFRREAVAMSSLANPHTVTTFELGEDRDGTRFIVMELLEGQSLAERFLAAGTLHWRDVLSIVRAVCDSLSEAHKLGIVHRDLKPANIFLCSEPSPDFVKVLDFGIAKILNGSNMHDGADLTRIGQAIGTLEYMSPEQLIGGELDGRTDVYTLGVVAYEMITGRRPFADATGATGLVTALMTRRPAPPSTVTRGALPPSLDGVLLRCLEREPDDRYATVEELAAAIDRMLATKLDLNTTQRQWVGTVSTTVTPLFDDNDDELTWIDSRPPIDEPNRPVSAPRFVASEIVEPPQFSAPRFDDAIRAQLTVTTDADGSRAEPRVRRAAGTGVPVFDSFDVSDSELPACEPTGARPLIATRYEISRAGTEPDPASVAMPRFAVGSSPLIADAPAADPVMLPSVVMLPPAPASRLRLGRLLLWVVALSAAGLGLGIAAATLAG